jgi:hypothetical protein
MAQLYDTYASYCFLRHFIGKSQPKNPAHLAEVHRFESSLQPVLTVLDVAVGQMFTRNFMPAKAGRRLSIWH